jgi:hypothetical protein
MDSLRGDASRVSPHMAVSALENPRALNMKKNHHVPLVYPHTGLEPVTAVWNSLHLTDGWDKLLALNMGMKLSYILLLDAVSYG